MALNESEKYPFILMANRDEFLKRPALPMAWWDDHPHLLAGKDLEAGGSWLGVTKAGRIAVVTNVRDLRDIRKDARSRGDLVTDFLLSDASMEQYQRDLISRQHDYNGYNLLFGDATGVQYLSNKSSETQTLRSGIHGLSNAALNTPWPKVVKGKEFLAEIIDREAQHASPAQLTDMMSDYMQSEELHYENLPDTGIGEEWEKKLSALYIDSGEYGTRVTTTILMDSAGSIHLREFNRREGRSVEFHVEL